MRGCLRKDVSIPHKRSMFQVVSYVEYGFAVLAVHGAGYRGAQCFGGGFLEDRCMFEELSLLVLDNYLGWLS